NLHFHAVVANVTRGPDGKWRALRNDRLWELNTLLNSMTMARFRLSVEKLGYETGPVGKHGNFEAAGITRAQVIAFSSRRRGARDARRGPGRGAGIMAAPDTRAAKPEIEDRDALGAAWRDTAVAVGLELARVIDIARTRAVLAAERERTQAPLLERGL